MSWSQCRAFQRKPTGLFFEWARLTELSQRVKFLARDMRKADADGLAGLIDDLDAVVEVLEDEVDVLGNDVEDIESWLREERRSQE